jgi:hypothetical protein
LIQTTAVGLIPINSFFLLTVTNFPTWKYAYGFPGKQVAAGRGKKKNLFRGKIEFKHMAEAQPCTLGHAEVQ